MGQSGESLAHINEGGGGVTRAPEIKDGNFEFKRGEFGGLR